LTNKGKQADLSQDSSGFAKLPDGNSQWFDAVASGGIGLWHFDARNNRAYWTDQLYRIVGYTREELPPSLEAFLSIVHDLDRDRVRKVIEDAMADQDDYRVECRVVDRLGKIVWLQVTGSTQRDSKGELSSIQGAAYDITNRINAEAELLETHVAYQRAVTAAGMVVYHYDFSSDQYITANLDLLEQLFGLKYRGSHSEFWSRIKLVKWQPLGEMSGLEPADAIRKFRSGELPVWRAEACIQKPDGQLRWIFDSAYLVNASDPATKGSFGILQDVTELRGLSETIRKVVDSTAATGQDYLRKLALAMCDALDAKYAFIGSLLPSEPPAIQTAAFAASGEIKDNFRYNLAGSPCQNVLDTGTCYHRSGVQSQFPGDVTLQKLGIEAYLGMPLRSPSGQLLGLIVVLNDQPLNEDFHPEDVLRLFAAHAAAELERQRVAKAQTDAEEFYRTLVSVQSEGIVVHDESDRILACNQSAQRMLRATEDQLLGRTSFDPRFQLVNVDGSPWDPGQSPSMIAVKTGVPQTRKVYGMRFHDGTTTWISVNAMPIAGAEGTGQRHVVVSFTDITEQIAAENRLKSLNADLEQLVDERTGELKRANRELESFAYSVSHDLRQPLRAIDGFSRILEMDYGDKLDEEAFEHIATIRSAARRMSNLIDDLLRLSRLVSHELDVSQIDLSLMAKEVFEAARSSQESRVCNFICPNGLKAKGDPNLIRAVMENLIQNSWKFTSKRENAEIEVGKTKEAFFIRDNGDGFNMAYSNKLFEPFQRLHSPKEFEGTGIGLATVRRIIERHHGHVWAESEVGVGTTIFFTLPE